MTSSTQVSILFLERLNASLRELAAAQTSAVLPATGRERAGRRTPAWLLTLAHASTAVSLLVLAGGVIWTWQ